LFFKQQSSQLITHIVNTAVQLADTTCSLSSRAASLISFVILLEKQTDDISFFIDRQLVPIVRNNSQ
jgi:hypothetical protein